MSDLGKIHHLAYVVEDIPAAAQKLTIKLANRLTVPEVALPAPPAAPATASASATTPAAATPVPQAATAPAAPKPKPAG